MATGEPNGNERIRRMYDAYNARDLETLAAFLTDDVDWPDGEERLHGRAAVADYWARQWALTQTHDEVVGLARPAPGQTAVRVRQVVRDLTGAVISTGLFEQTYTFHENLVARMNMRRLQSEQESQR